MSLLSFLYFSFESKPQQNQFLKIKNNNNKNSIKAIFNNTMPQQITTSSLSANFSNECPICHKLFYNKSSMKRHLSQHNKKNDNNKSKNFGLSKNSTIDIANPENELQRRGRSRSRSIFEGNNNINKEIKNNTKKSNKSEKDEHNQLSMMITNNKEVHKRISPRFHEVQNSSSTASPLSSTDIVTLSMIDQQNEKNKNNDIDPIFTIGSGQMKPKQESERETKLFKCNLCLNLRKYKLQSSLNRHLKRIHKVMISRKHRFKKSKMVLNALPLPSDGNINQNIEEHLNTVEAIVNIDQSNIDIPLTNYLESKKLVTESINKDNNNSGHEMTPANVERKYCDVCDKYFIVKASVQRHFLSLKHQKMLEKSMMNMQCNKQDSQEQTKINNKKKRKKTDTKIENVSLYVETQRSKKKLKIKNYNQNQQVISDNDSSKNVGSNVNDKDEGQQFEQIKFETTPKVKSASIKPVYSLPSK